LSKVADIYSLEISQKLFINSRISIKKGGQKGLVKVVSADHGNNR